MRTITIGGEDRDPDTQKAFDYSEVYRYALCDGGRQVAVWLRDQEHDWRRVLLADAETGRVLEKLDDVAPEYGGSIELCRDGRRVVYQDRNDRLWRFRHRAADGSRDDVGPVPTRFDFDDEDEDEDEDDEPDDTYCTLAASADGATVVMVGTRHPEDTDRTSTTRAQVWWFGPDGDPVEQRGPLADAELPAVETVAVSAGSRPLVALFGKTATVWDARTGEPVAGLDLPAKTAGDDDARVGALFSPDGGRLAVRVGDRVRVWDAGGWRAVDPSLPGGKLAGVAFTPDGRTLATSHPPGAVRFWDAATGTAGTAFELPTRTDRWNIADSVVGMAFAADGLTALAGFDSGVAVIWDVG